MTPGDLDERVVVDRSEWIRDTPVRLRELPIADFEQFVADQRNVAAAESYLRRALEALLDIGRHVLAKRFADAPTEYKEVARRLGEHGVLTPDETAILVQMAGYRNRLVHFYHTVSDAELQSICARRLGDIESVLGGIHRWVRQHAGQDEGRGT